MAEGYSGKGDDAESAVQDSAFNEEDPISFVVEVGEKLRLSAHTIAVAAILYHRIQLSPTKGELDISLLCLTVLYIAAKCEETPRDLRDVITTGYTTLHPNKPRLKIDSGYRDLRESLINCEQLALRALRYDLQVQTPFRMHILLLRSIEVDNHIGKSLFKDPSVTSAVQSIDRLAQKSWGVLRDAFYIPECALTKPHVLAAAAIDVASTKLGAATGDTLRAYLKRLISDQETEPSGLDEIIGMLHEYYNKFPER